MTRLFNLESYPQLCKYANLYQQNITNLIPEEDCFPSDYKSRLSKENNQGYLSDKNTFNLLITNSQIPQLQEFFINLDEINQDLYIINDNLNLLSLRNVFTTGEKYLYKTVYYYWNYYSQIQPFLREKTSLIFLDFNSINNPVCYPLKFSQNDNYLIPILDNRKTKSAKLTLNLQPKDIYNDILNDLAKEILTRNFPQLANNLETLNYLAHYLKNVNFFEQKDSVILEILHENNIYYKAVKIDNNLLEKVTLKHLNLSEIEEFIANNSEYLFVFLSEYNNLPTLQKWQTENLIIPNINQPEFKQIWEEKQTKNFPLFGQYLDNIQFKMSFNNEIVWLKLLSEEEAENIYYEGETEAKIFTAKVAETGQSEFDLPKENANLPFKINGEEYLVKGIIQDYKVYYPENATEDQIRVKIQFLMKPGMTPELKVTAEKYDIISEFRDKEKVFINYLSRKMILENRQKQSKENTISPEQQTVIIEGLKELENYLNSLNVILARKNVTIIDQVKNYVDNLYDKIHKTREGKDLFLNVNPNNEYNLKEVMKIINLAKLIEIIYDFIEYPSHYKFSNNYQRDNYKKSIVKMITFLGKNYRFSEYLNLDELTDTNIINNGCSRIGVEYFRFLSRIAINPELQLRYFNLFESNHKQEIAYQNDAYLWGYSRILLWYSHFNSTEIDYKNHFKMILKYLLTLPKEKLKNYKQNAFLSLIYLLTFRGNNPNFCVKNTEEYELAIKVCDKFQENQIFLNLISNEKSLNQYFEELLTGNCESEDAENLFKAD